MMMLFTLKEGSIGIPIGNLLSQIYALIYLSPLDHFVKRNLRIRHYVRYVDDFVLIGLDRVQCVVVKEQIIEFIRDTLSLRLSKSTIQRIKKGINFVGYRTWQTKKFIRKYSLYKFFRKAKQGQLQSVVSIAGHAKYTCSLPYMMERLRAINSKLLSLMPNCYRLAAL
jgi:hypothetical protein